VARNPAKWVQPKLVADEVEFRAWTTDRQLRHAAFKGLREGKGAEEVVAEEPRSADRLGSPEPATRTAAAPGAVAPSQEALAAYWRRVAKHALPYLARRPLTLVRHINGVTFFHEGPLPPVTAAVHQLRMRKSGGQEGTRLWVESLDGLLGLVKIGVVEIHPWGATGRRYRSAGHARV